MASPSLTPSVDPIPSATPVDVASPPMWSPTSPDASSVPSWMRASAISPAATHVVIIVFLVALLLHGLLGALFGFRLLVRVNRMAFPSASLATLFFIAFSFLAPWQLNVLFTGGLALLLYLLLAVIAYFSPLKVGTFFVGGGGFGNLIGFISFFILSLANLSIGGLPNPNTPPYATFIYSVAVGLFATICFGFLALYSPRKTIITSTVAGGSVLSAGCVTALWLYIGDLTQPRSSLHSSFGALGYVALAALIGIIVFVLLAVIGSIIQHRNKTDVIAEADESRIPLLDISDI